MKNIRGRSLAQIASQSFLLKSTLAVALSLNCLLAQAYIVSVFPNTRTRDTLKGNVPIHIVVVGGGDENKSKTAVSNLFFPAAMSRTLRYRELYPDHQIVVLTTRENEALGQGEKDLTQITKWGLKVIEVSDEPLSGANTLAFSDQFSKIASLDFYGHSNVQFGTRLESDLDRITLRLDGLDRLKDNFLRPGGYVTINGCNSGFYLAPTLSQLWNIPVMGSFTGTDYQRNHSLGGWYFNNPGDYPLQSQAGPSGEQSIWAQSNQFSYDSPKACIGPHGCMRMKPSRGSYYGMWSPPKGFSAGSNIYKFFCSQYNENIKSGPAYVNCMMGVANAMIAYPSVHPIKIQSDWSLIKENAMDYLCPAPSSKSLKPSAATRVNVDNAWKLTAPETPVDARDRCVKAILDSEQTGNLLYDGEFNREKQTLECETGVWPEMDPASGIYLLVGGIAQKRVSAGLFSSAQLKWQVTKPVYRGCQFSFACEIMIDSTGRRRLAKNTCDISVHKLERTSSTFMREYRLILEALQFAKTQ